jgi:hypothetical protein
VTVYVVLDGQQSAKEYVKLHRILMKLIVQEKRVNYSHTMMAQTVKNVILDAYYVMVQVHRTVPVPLVVELQ